MKEKLEIRSFTDTPKLTGRNIFGYAVVFNSRSEILFNGERRFREIIKPEAITPQLIDRCDIKALLEHERGRLLARSNKGKGTLSLTIDNRGLRYQFEAPNTSEGDYAVEMVKRGDIEGSSFGFRADKDIWTKESNSIWLRTITRISIIVEISITSNPAYSQTEVNVRNKSALNREMFSQLEALEARSEKLQQKINERNIQIAKIEQMNRVAERNKLEAEKKESNQEMQQRLSNLSRYKK